MILKYQSCNYSLISQASQSALRAPRSSAPPCNPWVSLSLSLSLSTLLSDAFWPVLPHAGSDFRESLGYAADAGRTAAANTPYKRSASSKARKLSRYISLYVIRHDAYRWIIHVDISRKHRGLLQFAKRDPLHDVTTPLHDPT